MTRPREILEMDLAAYARYCAGKDFFTPPREDGFLIHYDEGVCAHWAYKDESEKLIKKQEEFKRIREIDEENKNALYASYLRMLK